MVLSNFIPLRERKSNPIAIFTMVDDICKMIPYNPANPISIKDFLTENKQIKKMIKNDINIQNLFKYLQILRDF